VFFLPFSQGSRVQLCAERCVDSQLMSFTVARESEICFALACAAYPAQLPKPASYKVSFHHFGSLYGVSHVTLRTGRVSFLMNGRSENRSFEAKGETGEPAVVAISGGELIAQRAEPGRSFQRRGTVAASVESQEE